MVRIMSDYIDRQDVIDILVERFNSYVDFVELGTPIKNELLEVVQRTKAIPSADVVPVVRCKDCEFYTEDERWCRRLGLCGAFDANGYCSHAERSEE